MALSEGFKGFVDMLKGTFSSEPEDMEEDEVFGTFGNEYSVEDNLARKPQSDLDDLYPTATIPSSFSKRQRGRETNVTPITKSY